MAKRRPKKTPEELAAQRAEDEDLRRRLLAMIEKYRKLSEQKRAS